MWLRCLIREILQLRLSVCPAKPSSLVHVQMASGHTRVTEVTSVPTLAPGRFEALLSGRKLFLPWPGLGWYLWKLG